MKSKSIIFLLTITTIVSIILLLILGNYIFELEHQISKKNTFIEKSIKNDSIIDAKTKEYANKIEKFVQDCNFYIDGKKISQKEILQIVNKTLNENSKLRDSLFRLKFILKNAKRDYGISYNVTRNGDTLISSKNFTKADTALAYYPKLKVIENKYYKILDSLEKYKWQAELVKKDYGIKYNIHKEGKTLKSTRIVGSKIDSALVLLKYFRHRLSKDKNGNWEIETDAEYRRQQRKKERAKN
jgi:hypothetical protein